MAETLDVIIAYHAEIVKLKEELAKCYAEIAQLQKNHPPPPKKEHGRWGCPNCGQPNSTG